MVRLLFDYRSCFEGRYYGCILNVPIGPFAVGMEIECIVIAGNKLTISHGYGYYDYKINITVGK